MLNYVIDKIYLVEEFKFLEETLDPIDYIIFWNSQQAYKYNYSSLSREFLELLITKHASKWINPRSILSGRMKGSTSREYIQSKINKMLSTDAEYEGALKLLTLTRFDELKNMPKEEDEIAIQDQINQAKQIAKYRFSEASIMKLADVSIGKEVNIGKQKFGRDTLPEMFLHIAEEIKDNYSINEESSYRNGLINRLANQIKNYEDLVKLNIGKDICSPLKAGDMWSIIAEKKVGKTKFMLGEIVYPALVTGRNVRVCSGEMSEAEVLSAVIVKHIYVMTKQKLNSLNVGAYLSYIATKELGMPISKAIEKKISKITPEMRELIDTAFYQLTEGSGIGKLYVPSMRDEARIAIEGDDFAIKGGKERMIKIIQRDNIDLVVWDHMGFFHTPDPNSDKLSAEQAYRTALDVAKNNIRPVGAVCINHTMTGAKYDNPGEVRAFGTSAAEKDAAVSLALTQTQEEAADGMATLMVLADRNQSASDEFGSTTFAIYADKMVNDFVISGTEKKDYAESQKF